MAAKYSEETWQADDGQQLFLRKWLPGEESPKAILILLHGLAEHSARYKLFATELNDQGIAVYAPDHRGHGRTATYGIKGFFAAERGWDLVVSDCRAIMHRAQREWPKIPTFLFGHSMGSFLSQSLIQTESSNPRLMGVVLSGSNYAPPASYRLGQCVAKLEAFRQGAKGLSRLVDFLSFGSFNRRFAPVRTAFDWLSSTPEEVDLYVADPDCGYLCTNQLWIDMLDGLARLSSAQGMKRIRSELPLLILCGEQDPVGGRKGIETLAGKLRDAGLKNVRTHVFANARHEILNERQQHPLVVKEILQWMRPLMDSYSPGV